MGIRKNIAKTLMMFLKRVASLLGACTFVAGQERIVRFKV